MSEKKDDLRGERERGRKKRDSQSKSYYGTKSMNKRVANRVEVDGGRELTTEWQQLTVESECHTARVTLVVHTDLSHGSKWEEFMQYEA